MAGTWYKKMNDDDQRGHGEGERLHFFITINRKTKSSPISAVNLYF